MFGILPFIMLLVSAAVFWLAYVFVTQDHNQSWKLMILWIILANLLILPAGILTEMSKTGSYSLVSEILGLVLMYGFLYFILTYKYSVHSFVKKVQILAIHLIATHLFGWIAGLAFRN